MHMAAHPMLAKKDGSQPKSGTFFIVNPDDPDAFESTSSVISFPPTTTFVVQFRWLIPIISINTLSTSVSHSRAICILVPTGILQSPIVLTFVCFNTNSVNIPAGLVKLSSIAFGASSSMSLQISRITGIVLQALSQKRLLLLFLDQSDYSAKEYVHPVHGLPSNPTRNCVITKSASLIASRRSNVKWS